MEKDELINLCKDLGQELSDEQYAEALKDLDVNGDGVIDLGEFKRWWFSGLKSYSGQKRSMLFAKKKANDMLKAIVSGNFADSPLSGNLKTQDHEIEVSFNAPKDEGLKVSAHVYPGGDTCHAIHEDLKSKYQDGTLDEKLLPQLLEALDSPGTSNLIYGYVEVSIKTQSGAAAGVKDKLDALYKKVVEFKDKVGVFIPKISATDDTVLIGCSFPIPAGAQKAFKYNKVS